MYLEFKEAYIILVEFHKRTWGKRGQLHIEQHDDRLPEIYADIAYGSGLVMYFAGTPISWAASQEPFVTYSTAHSRGRAR